MQERDKRVIEAWLTGKYNLGEIASMNGIGKTLTSRIITDYLKSLKKNK